MWEQEKWTWPHHRASRFVTAGGIRWHLQEMGSGPVLLLIHGTGASTHSWRSLAPLLVERYTVLSVDLPGHGFSSPAPPGRCTIDGISAALAALLRELAVAPRYYVGHSAGAVIACRLALDQQPPPGAIIAINGAFAPLPGAAVRVFSPIARLMAAGPLPHLLSWTAGGAASVSRLIASTGSRLDAEGVELYSRLVRKPAHVAGALAMMGGWDLDAFAARLPRLTVPLVLIVGENDQTVSPNDASWVQARVPGTQIHRLGKLGHLAHEEDAAAVAAVMRGVFDAH